MQMIQVETIFMRLIRGVRLHHLSANQKDKRLRSNSSFSLQCFYKKDFPKLSIWRSTNKRKSLSSQSYSQPLSATVRKENVRVKKREFWKKVSDYQSTLAEFSETVDVEDCLILSFSETTWVLLQQYLSHFPDLSITQENNSKQVHHILRIKSPISSSIKNGYEHIKGYQPFKFVESDQVWWKVVVCVKLSKSSFIMKVFYFHLEFTKI